MQTFDTFSQAFPYTNEGHAAYLLWYEAYQARMREKYGSRLKNTMATHSEMEVDGKRMMLVVAQADIAEEK